MNSDDASQARSPHRVRRGCGAEVQGVLTDQDARLGSHRPGCVAEDAWQCRVSPTRQEKTDDTFRAGEPGREGGQTPVNALSCARAALRVVQKAREIQLGAGGGDWRMRKFDASVPREMFWLTDVARTNTCPRCGSALENDSQTYMCVVRSGGEEEPFIAGNDLGYFCPRCPVVVLDHGAFAEHAALVASGGHILFAVLGLVDLDAVPEDKRHLMLGADDNPIPLVRFSNVPGSNREPQLGGKPRDNRTRKKRRNRSRPCGGSVSL